MRYLATSLLQLEVNRKLHEWIPKIMRAGSLQRDSRRFGKGSVLSSQEVGGEQRRQNITCSPAFGLALQTRGGGKSFLGESRQKGKWSIVPFLSAAWFEACAAALRANRAEAGCKDG